MKQNTNSLNDSSLFHSILIIGNGRLSKHLVNYFQMLGISFSQWSRSQPAEKLDQLLKECSYVWLAIRDDAIDNFYNNHAGLKHKVVIHSSGSHYNSNIVGAHWLSTFGDSLYDLETYKKIPFILDQKLDAIRQLPNPQYFIRPIDKPLYHAMCVWSGNFTTILWKQAQLEFEKLGLPANIINSYISQVCANIINEKTPLTGPLARQDRNTVEANLKSLNPIQQKIYYGFLELIWPQYFEKDSR